MTPAKLMHIANQATAFNQSVEQFARTGSALTLQRDLLVTAFREMGMLKDEAEEMVARVKYEESMPEPDADDTDNQPQDAGRQEDAPAADGDAEAA